ncbi:hypothetical protein FLAN108750_13480 [Flavobacterium antarcticum]|uniref:hypothetical protein n=1 Tax=Flavobacterium antarcticum TaxID=271155 RepID=UPI0003B3CD52|nr:hypothetical protein [Flavobacterium antarcticum]
MNSTIKDKKQFICHSGGATGADTYFEKIGEKYGVLTKAYSYKTASHKSKNKVEISESDFQEGINRIEIAAKTLKRKTYNKFMPLLSRNWQQIKNSNQVFAISEICKRPGLEYVAGGTGWAVQMAIDNRKDVYVFDQEQDAWYKWSYGKSKFNVLKKVPTITETNFAGIGARKIKENGIQAIKDLYEASITDYKMKQLIIELTEKQHGKMITHLKRGTALSINSESFSGFEIRLCSVDGNLSSWVEVEMLGMIDLGEVNWDIKEKN